MSKALLKKSLAFVRSGSYNDGQPNHSKGKDNSERKSLKKKVKTKVQTPPARLSTTTMGQPEREEAVAKKNNMLYFTKRRVMKTKVIKTLAESGVTDKRLTYLSPEQMALEKRRIRLQRRKKQATKKRLQEKNPFSIFSIPHLTS